MDSKELRIGNTVNYRGKPTDINVNSLLAISNGSENYTPIPLTPEILEKCGFTHQYIGGRSYPIFDDSPYGRKSMTVTENTDKAAGMWCLILTTFPPKGEIDLGTDCIFIRMDLRHLHELQNCFHSLIGSELPVSL